MDVTKEVIDEGKCFMNHAITRRKLETVDVNIGG